MKTYNKSRNVLLSVVALLSYDVLMIMSVRREISKNSNFNIGKSYIFVWINNPEIILTNDINLMQFCL